MKINRFPDPSYLKQENGQLSTQKDSQTLVSVIIIFFCAEKFIREAIESVLAQTFTNWELLLVDDGSTDRSSEIALEYAGQFPERVRYLTHAGRINRGMSASRNLGIQTARGGYLAFLDADDVWFPNTLKDQVAILEAHPEAALVYGPIQYWFSWTGHPGDRGRDTIEKLGVPPDSVIHPPELLHLFLRDRAAVPSGILVRRAAIEQFGAFEDAFKGEYEDQVFCAKMCLHAPVFASSQCWYRYRQHPDSCVSVGHETGRAFAARRIFLDWMKDYLSRQEIKDWIVWWALRQEYWQYEHPRLFHFLKANRHLLPRIIG